MKLVKKKRRVWKKKGENNESKEKRVVRKEKFLNIF